MLKSRVCQAGVIVEVIKRDIERRIWIWKSVISFGEIVFMEFREFPESSATNSFSIWLAVYGGGEMEL